MPWEPNESMDEESKLTKTQSGPYSRAMTHGCMHMDRDLRRAMAHESMHALAMRISIID